MPHQEIDNISKTLGEEIKIPSIFHSERNIWASIGMISLLLFFEFFFIFHNGSRNKIILDIIQYTFLFTAGFSLISSLSIIFEIKNKFSLGKWYSSSNILKIKVLMKESKLTEKKINKWLSMHPPNYVLENNYYTLEIFSNEKKSDSYWIHIYKKNFHLNPGSKH